MPMMAGTQFIVVRKLIARDVGGTLACVENLFAASPLVLACFALQFVVFVVFVFVAFVQLWSCPCFPPQLVVTNTTLKNSVLCHHIELGIHFVAVHSTLKTIICGRM